MDHTIEEAPSGRAKCRACGASIAKGTLRFGERLPNPFSDDAPMTVWFHLLCGAYRRPESFAAVLDEIPAQVEDPEALRSAVEAGMKHRRLERAAGVERASSGRAKCRSCREKIEKDAWRIRIAFFEDGRFQPGGFIHLECAEAYFDTRDLYERLVHFTPPSEADATELVSILRSP